MRLQMIQVDVIGEPLTAEHIEQLNDICGCKTFEAICERTATVWYAVPDREAVSIHAAVEAHGYAASLITDATFNAAQRMIQLKH